MTVIINLLLLFQFCQKVWLALHDKRVLRSVNARDEVKMKELMTQRYEKKLWYIAPTDAMYEEARKQNISTPVTTSKQNSFMRPTFASVQVFLSCLLQSFFCCTLSFAVDKC